MARPSIPAAAALAWVLAASAGASPAAAQAPEGPAGPGPLPSPDQIELITGEVLSGPILRKYWPPGKPEEGEAAGLVQRRADGLEIYVPSRYFSPAEWYWLTYYFYHEPANHPFFQPSGETVTADIEYQVLAGRAIDAGLFERARYHCERAVQKARAEKGDAEGAAWQAAYEKRVREVGLILHPEDGRWLTEREYQEGRGWKQWVDGTWLSPEDYAKRRSEMEATELRKPKLEDPGAYRRVHLALVRAFPGDWPARKDGHKVRIYGRLVGPPEEQFPALGKWEKGTFRRIRTLADDCGDIYVEKGRKWLIERLGKLPAGTAVAVFGRLTVGGGRVILEAEDVVLR